jgi:alkaline phosphatase
MFYELRPDLMLGGGSAYFLPKSDKAGRRKDEENYLERFREARLFRGHDRDRNEGSGVDNGTLRLLDLFHPSNLDGALDRRLLKKGSVAAYPDQPDLAEQTQVAIEIRAKHKNGFVLMLESGLIDKFSHVLDWERAVYDTIMLDNAVAVAKRFAAQRDDTLIIVVADHAHPVSIIGTYDDDRRGERLRDKLGVYNEAKFPNYRPTATAIRLPSTFHGGWPSFSRAFPTTVPPASRSSAGRSSRRRRKRQSGRQRELLHAAGNAHGRQSAVHAARGVHAADDVVLTAMGPGSELCKGRVDNT